jgi:hypothetical protein
VTHDIEVLTRILKGCLFVAAFLATAFPVLYMFSPWWSTWLGKLLMLHAFALALALDVTAIFTFWQPSDILVYFWVEVFVFGLIALANGLMCWMLWRTNHSKWSLNRSVQKER